MVEDALSFWTEIQRYEDMLAADSKSLCFAPLSELYRKLGLLEDAVSVAEKGCAAHPEYHLGFVALGNACYAKGMPAEARRALERAVSLQPDHIQAMKLLSQLYVELGEISLARQTLGQLLTRDPDDLESKMLLNSIASTAAPEAPGVAGPEPQEEELLEDLEIIEELDEVLDEPAAPAPAPPAPATVPAPAVEADSEDVWAIEDLEDASESAAAAPAPRAATPDPLTTATLAELYVSQGFLDKAIGIYRELLTAHPDNQQYRLRVEELLEQKELQHAPAESPAVSAAVEPAAPEAAAAVPAAAASAPLDTAEVFDLDDVPAAMEVPGTTAETASPIAFAGMEAPAEQEAASLEQPWPAEAPSDEDLESSLQRWLENIRRRKDGV